jgi:hypothetical protein
MCAVRCHSLHKHKHTHSYTGKRTHTLFSHQFVLDFRKANTAESKLKIVAARRAHHAIAGRERTDMQANLRFSFSNPTQLAMLYVDYASAFKLPHFQRTPEVHRCCLFPQPRLTLFAEPATQALHPRANGRHNGRHHRRAHVVAAPAFVRERPEFHRHLLVA